MPAAGRIPREVVAFFESPGGHSLIVKGPAGTGKTTFALQLTEETGDVASSHYLSSRVSDESLYNQFTWLHDRIRPAGLQTGAKAPRQTKVARDALNQLEGKLEEGKEGEEGDLESVGSGEVKGNFLEVTLGFDLPELEAAYDFVDARLPKRSLVLIDSIDALAEHYGIPAARLITVLQRDLVEGSKQNVLYVLESSGETRLDYLGDGVVSLVSSEYEGRRLRVLTIEKLRGQQIQQHRYLYTLNGGRLTAFEIHEQARPQKPQVWKPIKDLSKDAVSSGLESLDRLTGGLIRGRAVAFEISNAVPLDHVDFLRMAIICNFVAQGRGVAHVPPRKGTAEFARELLAPHLPSEAFDAHVRVFEAATLGSADVSRTVLHMEGTNVDSDLKWSNVEFQLPKSERPFLAFMAFDTLESVYSDKVLEQMSGVFGSIRRGKDVFVGFVTPQSASAGKLENLARVVLHIETINGSVVLYGSKPYTGLFSLSWDVSAGVPKADLRPIV
ncbi:MAG TPA: gas vesicle protein GvpD P-loop domain-containing protein [Thermoplasmata archaeon]